MLKLYWLPTINAAIELSKKQSPQAIVLLEAAAPYELGSTECNCALFPVYVRGQAYLLEHNGIAAAGEFQKLLDRRGIVLNSVMASLAHLQIGRAYAIMGDTVKAKAAYQDFLTLWKDADPRHSHPEASQGRVREAAMKEPLAASHSIDCLAQKFVN